MNVTSELPCPAGDERVVADALFGTLYVAPPRPPGTEPARARRPGRRRSCMKPTSPFRDGRDRLRRPRPLHGLRARVRGLIIDDVRRRRSKRGGLFEITSLGLDHADSVIDPSSLILISDALDELAEVEPNLAEIVDLKFFCGFSFAEIAAMRGVSEPTIQRNWEKGRLYLHHAIGRAAPARPTPMPRISPERWRVLSPYWIRRSRFQLRAGRLARLDLGQGRRARHRARRDPGRAPDRPRFGVPRAAGARSPQRGPQLLAGQVVGSSRLVSHIGQGGSGSVWLAERVTAGELPRSSC